MSLTDRTVLITGAASGIGAACGRKFSEQGAKVVLTDINKEDGKSLVNELVETGGQALFFEHDVAKEEDWQRVITDTVGRFGGLDVLVNNAGVLISGNPETTTLEQFHLSNSVMSDGVFLGCKYAIPAIRDAGGGAIINMSSVAAQLGVPDLMAYSAAKGAVRSMTKTVAVYCQKQGNNIRCNSVHPGAVDTPMAGGFRQSNPKLKPIAERAHPDEVASLILYLASDESRFMNGSEVVFDNALIIN